MPELVLVVFAFALVGLSFVVKKNERALGMAAMAAVIISMFLVLRMLFFDALAFIPFPAEKGVYFGLFEVDTFSLLFKVIFLTVAFLVVLSSPDHIKGQRNIGEYYALLLLATTGMMVVASANDLITLFIGIELSSMSTYILAGFFKQDPKSSEASAKFFIIGALSSALVIYGMSLLYGAAGTLSFSGMGAAIAAKEGFEPVTALAIVFLIGGFGFKIAAVPFHMWAPDVYEGAPLTITTFLATGSKKMGFVAVIKLFLIGLIAVRAQWDLLLGIMAVATMFVGNAAALSQTNMRRMLAFSSIAQAGYIMIALPLTTSYGLAGGTFHMITHVFMKGGAFLMVTALVTALAMGDRTSDYKGLHKRSPLLAFAMSVFLLSLAGVPPLAGFASKWVLFSSAIDASLIPGREWLLWLAVFGIINSALSLYYYARIIKYMYVNKAETEERIKLPGAMMAAILICLVATIVMVFPPIPDTVINLCIEAGRVILP
jgi:NADH-quinone oxidoreductase subunit N